MSVAPLACPDCGEAQGVPIVWGLPHPDEVDRPDVVFGGCVVPSETPPDTRCRGCGHSWRSGPVSLRWPDPRTHADGERVFVDGTVGRVVLEATDRGSTWADFELLVDDVLPRLRCVAFPTAFSELTVALEPGLAVRLTGRFSHAVGPTLHVASWVLQEDEPTDE